VELGQSSQLKETNGPHALTTGLNAYMILGVLFIVAGFIWTMWVVFYYTQLHFFSPGPYAVVIGAILIWIGVTQDRD
jgi:hypothetical protein